MAAQILEQTQTTARIVPGARGEFTVWVDGNEVAGKSADGFPQTEQVVDRVRDALGAPA